MSTTSTKAATPNGMATSATTSSSSAAVVATTNNVVASEVMAITTAIERMRDLEALFLGGPLISSNEAKCFSTETLLDILMVLYNECCNSSLRKEKTVSEFIELGKLIFIVCYKKMYIYFLTYQNLRVPINNFIEGKSPSRHKTERVF